MTEPIIPSNSVTPHHSDHENAWRYMAYLNRIGPTLMPLLRYTAYMSDVGEAARPVVSKVLVRAAYGLSWGYVLTDTVLTAKAHYDPTSANNGYTVSETAISTLLFHSLASMGLPALTIHTVVAVTKKAILHAGYQAKWTPTIAGLAVIPALHFLIDHPVEQGIEWAVQEIKRI